MGIFDLHVHTSFLSEDSTIDPVLAVRRLEAMGFQGLALTEHNAVWPAGRLRELQQQTSLVVVAGIELEVEDVGHVVVLGWDDEPVWRYHRLDRLMEVVDFKRLVVSVAHPFRPWYPLWAGQTAQPVSDPRSERLQSAWERIGCIEFANGRMRPEANRRAQQMQEKTGWNITAGSDAHRLDELGTAGLILPGSVRSGADVIEAIRNHSQCGVFPRD